MKSSRNHSMIIGNKVFTNMTAREVSELSAIMSPISHDTDERFISVEDYIQKYNPFVRKWVSKKGTEMISVEILHDIIDRNENDMTFPADGIFRNSLPLKK